MTKHIGHVKFDEILSNMGVLELLGKKQVELCLTSNFSGQINIGDRAGVIMFENLADLSYRIQELVLESATKQASQNAGSEE